MKRPFSSKANAGRADRFKQRSRRGRSGELIREDSEREEREERKALATIDPKDIRTGEPTYDL